LIRLRQGQPAFRASLLQAYENRCAITESDAIEVLEAAHITPFAEGGPMAPVNGLLLRADIHTLFDLGLIAVDTRRWAVLVHPKLCETQFGINLDGVQVRRPRDTAMRPDVSRLDAHRRILGL
jgi:predicted restriction endonuclease